MSANRGKEWEDLFKTLCGVKGVQCVRFHDTLYSNKKGVDNPCDFVISKDRNSEGILIECKACENSSFSISKFKQMPRLVALTNFKSYVVIWLISIKKVYAFPVDKLNELCGKGLKTISERAMQKNPELNSIAILLTDRCKRVKPIDLCIDRLWD